MTVKKDDNEEEILVVEEPEEKVSGEIDSSEEDEKAKKAAKRRGSDGNSRRGEDARKKINAQWMKIKEVEELASKESRRADGERAKNQEYEKITASALEENLNTKRELLTERLIRAQESDDKERTAKITAELSKVEAQAAQIDRYKIETQVQSTQQQLQPQTRKPSQSGPVPIDDVYESMSPAGRGWIDENRDWYDPSSDNYDSERTGDVTYYAKTLEGEYIRSGKGALIGTRAYFKEIDNYIKENWDMDGEEAEPEEVVDSAPKKKNYAAPVGNRNSANQQSTTRKEYKITQSEKEMALSIDTKGKDGKSLSDNDKIKRFISLRESTPSSGPISIKSLNNKGS